MKQLRFSLMLCEDALNASRETVLQKESRELRTPDHPIYVHLETKKERKEKKSNPRVSLVSSPNSWTP